MATKPNSKKGQTDRKDTHEKVCPVQLRNVLIKNLSGL